MDLEIEKYYSTIQIFCKSCKELRIEVARLVKAIVCEPLRQVSGSPANTKSLRILVFYALILVIFYKPPVQCSVRVYMTFPDPTVECALCLHLLEGLVEEIGWVGITNMVRQVSALLGKRRKR